MESLSPANKDFSRYETLSTLSGVSCKVPETHQKTRKPVAGNICNWLSRFLIK